MNRKVLIIDDTKDLNDIFSMAFEWEGFTVQQAFSGKQGFDVYKKFHPDVVLLDIRMPEMDGNEVLRNIQKDTSHTPLIIMFSNLEWKGEQSDHVHAINKSNITPTAMVERVKILLELNEKFETISHSSSLHHARQ